MIQYYEPSISAAKEMTKNCHSDFAKYKVITDYISKNILYDYVRAITIPKINGKPDIKRTWNYKMGICLDISALTTGMLRGVGVNAKMCIGKADKRQHAWVEVAIKNRKYRYDHDGKAKSYKTERTF